MALERADLFSDRTLAVSGLILVQDTFANCLVEFAIGILQRFGSCLLVALAGSLANGLDSRLQFGADSPVASLSLAVGLNALNLGFDVCHVLLSLWFGNLQNKLKL